MDGRQSAREIAVSGAAGVLAAAILILACPVVLGLGAMVARSGPVAASSTALSAGVPLWAVLLALGALAAIPPLRRRREARRRSSRLLEASRRVVAHDIAREREQDHGAAYERHNRERAPDRARQGATTADRTD
jgi:hypothetical protein